MADKYKAILQELCGTALNFPAGELQTLLAKTDEELTDEEVTAIGEKVKGKYREVVSSINKTNQLKLDEKFKAGQRNKAEEFETELREKFNVDSEKTGAELIEDILTSVTEASKKSGKDKLTDDEVKKHPAFLKAESELKKQLKKLEEDSKKELDTLKGTFSKKEVFDKVSKKALEIFDSMNPVLSDDPVKAAAQRQLLVDKLASYDYQEVDNDFTPLKDSKRVEDEFGNATDLTKLVKDIASPIFDFLKAEDRQSPNGKQKTPANDPVDPAKQKTAYKGAFPKTEAEYTTMMDNENLSITDRTAINEHWHKKSAEPVK